MHPDKATHSMVETVMLIWTMVILDPCSAIMWGNATLQESLNGSDYCQHQLHDSAFGKDEVKKAESERPALFTKEQTYW